MPSLYHIRLPEFPSRRAPPPYRLLLLIFTPTQNNISRLPHRFHQGLLLSPLTYLGTLILRGNEIRRNSDSPHHENLLVCLRTVPYALTFISQIEMGYLISNSGDTRQDTLSLNLQFQNSGASVWREISWRKNGLIDSALGYRLLWSET